jgi:hypothetical protein
MNSYLVQIRDAVVGKFIVLSASIFSGMTARPAGVWDSSRDIFLKSASETVKDNSLSGSFVRNIQHLLIIHRNKKSGAGVQPER